MSNIFSNDIISSEKIKENFQKKNKEIFNRINLVLENLEIEKNLEDLTKIYENLVLMENYLDNLESNIDINNISKIEEKNRIMDKKIFKLFTPFLLYYKMCLMQNNN